MISGGRSALVLPDNPAQGLDGGEDRLLDAVGGIDVGTVALGDGPVEIGGGHQDGGGAHAQAGAHGEEDGLLHGGADSAAPDVALPAADQLVGHRLRLRFRLGVEGVLGDADAHRGVEAQGDGALLQGLQQLVAGHSGELQGQVVAAGAVHADAAADHHDVAALNVGAGGGTGAHPDEGVRPALVELLHTDGGGGAADAGGGDGDPLPLQRALPGGEFPLPGHHAGVVQMGGDQFAPVRVPGDDGVAARLSGGQVHMEHFGVFRHMTDILSRISRI